jgi:hypothetical protein
MMAKRILLDKVQIQSNLFGSSNVLLQNISDSIRTAKLPVTFEMKSNDTNAAVNVKFDYSAGGPTPAVTGDFNDFDLSKLQSSLSGDSGLMFESGVASGKFGGMVTNQVIDLTINLTVRDMKARAQGDQLLGLDAKTASEALSVLNNISTKIRVVGPITEPRLAFDVKGLQDAFKKALVDAGKAKVAEEIDKQKAELDKEIDEQIEKQLGDEAPDEVKDALKKSKGLLDGLLGGKKEDDN